MLFIPDDFSLLAVNIDLGFDGGEGATVLENYLRENGYRYIIDRTGIGPQAHAAGAKKNPCFICSRLRRRRMFEIAAAEDCNKVVLAHHRDDIIETLLINIFYGREISTMMPNQSDLQGKDEHHPSPGLYQGRAGQEIREGAGIPGRGERMPHEQDIQAGRHQRAACGMEKENKKVRDNVFRSLYHVKPDYLPGANLVKSGKK